MSYADGRMSSIAILADSGCNFELQSVRVIIEGGQSLLRSLMVWMSLLHGILEDSALPGVHFRVMSIVGKY